MATNNVMCVSTALRSIRLRACRFLRSGEDSLMFRRWRKKGEEHRADMAPQDDES
jgi:hypothetical protein